MMEPVLRANLLTMAELYASVANVAMSTVSRRCRAENGFFARIAKGETSFTVRTYDEAMTWFAANWPAGENLPAQLRRYVGPAGVPLPTLAAPAEIAPAP